MSDLNQDLNAYTIQIIALLKEADGKDVDLVDVETQLHINKRKLYDIINILTGIDIVERTGKNKVRLLHKPQPEKEQPDPERDRLAQLQQLGSQLDHALMFLMRSEDYANYAYVTPDDLTPFEPEQTSSVYILKGSSAMSLSFEESDETEIICCDPAGPIHLKQIPES